MSARDIVGGLAEAAIGAVKHPVGTAGEAVSKARTAVGAGTAVGTAVAGTMFRRVRGDAAEAKGKAADAAKEAPGKAADQARATAGKAAGTAKDVTGKAAGTAKQATSKAGKAADKVTDKAVDEAEGTAKGAAGAAKEAGAKATEKASDKASDAEQTAKKAAKKATNKITKKAPAKKPGTKKVAGQRGAKKAAAEREPQIVLAEPAPPEEPPIDVVGEALAAEAQNPDNVGFGRTTEPRGASRDEEHGEAALQTAEVNEIAEEMAEVARAGNLDLGTPVGTTGADTGFNPDTAEADLQQPGTEPLVDPSLTSEVKSEQETLAEAAEPKKPKPKKKS